MSHRSPAMENEMPDKKKPDGMKFEFGGNVLGKLDGEILTLTVDLGKNLGRSKSGKSLLVGTTKGVRPVPNHKKTRVVLTVFRYEN